MNRLVGMKIVFLYETEARDIEEHVGPEWKPEDSSEIDFSIARGFQRVECVAGHAELIPNGEESFTARRRMNKKVEDFSTR